MYLYYYVIHLDDYGMCLDYYGMCLDYYSLYFKEFHYKNNNRASMVIGLE